MGTRNPITVKKLGELLLDAGVVTQDQLDIALAEQRRTGSKLGNILTELGVANEEAISRALASQSGVEHFDLSELELQRDAIRCVPEELARRCVLEKNKLVVAMANPGDIMAIDEIERTSDLFVEAAAASRRQILRAIDEAYASRAKHDSALEEAIRRASEDLDGNEGEGGVIALVEEILGLAARRDATDVHFEPDKQVVRVRLRVNGDLIQGPTLASSLLAPIVARIKILAQLDIAETRVPQDGKIRFPFRNRTIDLRVSTFPCIHGESVVVRLLDTGRKTLRLDTIGLSEDQIALLAEAGRRPNGLILTAGPTGSGKTTTLYALLRAIDTSSRKVITLEDPVEYELSLASQCQINEKAGLGFATGLRAILRHDPDVILVGEMRGPGDLPDGVPGRPHRAPGALDDPHERLDPHGHAPARHRHRAVPHRELPRGGLCPATGAALLWRLSGGLSTPPGRAGRRRPAGGDRGRVRAGTGLRPVSPDRRGRARGALRGVAGDTGSGLGDRQGGRRPRHRDGGSRRRTHDLP